jgi:hypothetical protein
VNAINSYARRALRADGKALVTSSKVKPVHETGAIVLVHSIVGVCATKNGHIYGQA